MPLSQRDQRHKVTKYFETLMGRWRKQNDPEKKREGDEKAEAHRRASRKGRVSGTLRVSARQQTHLCSV
jgi:hypothetical protein